MADAISKWTFFPLYGLKVADDPTGIEEPIFGDATIVAAEWLYGEMSKRAENEAVAKMAVHRPVEEWLPDINWREIGVPQEQLFQLPPHSYIAVRRWKEKDAVEYVESLRALLTATMFLRAGRTTGFSLTPSDVAWTFMPKCARVLPDGRSQASYAVWFNERVILNSLVVTKAQLKASWQDGTGIDIGKGGVWDIWHEHPVCQLLVGSAGGTQRRKRLRALAVHLARSCCSSNPTSQIQMAITAMEVAFGTNEFSRLKAIAHSFLPDPKNQADLGTIESARHNFVHQGELLDGEESKNLGMIALGLAYVFFDIAVGYLDAYPDTEKFRTFLDAQVATHRLAENLEAINGKDARAAFESSAFKALFSKNHRLTVRMK